MKLQTKTSKSPTGLQQPFGVLDWVCTALLAVVALLAPMVAGSFVIPADLGLYPPGSLLDWLQTLGVPLVLGLVGCSVVVESLRECLHPVPVGGVQALTPLGIGIACWAALSLVHVHALYLGIDALTFLLAALAAATLVSRLGRERNALIVLLLSFMAGGVLVSAVGINEYLVSWKDGSIAHRVFGTFLNPDFFAGYLLLPLPITLAIFVASRERLVRLASGFALFLLAACLTLTASRAGLGGLVLGIGMWLALGIWSGVLRGRHRLVAWAIGVLLVAFVVASAPVRFRVGPQKAPLVAAKPLEGEPGKQIAPVAESHSLLFRRYTWDGTLRMVEVNPILGVGIGNFSYSYPRYALVAYTAHAHNSFLQWGAETGLVGLLLLLMILAASSAFAANALRLRRVALEAPYGDTLEPFHALFEEPGVLLSGLLAALFASVIKTMFDSDWYVVATGLSVALVFGLTVGLARNMAPLTTHLPVGPKRWVGVVGGLVGLLMVGRASELGVVAYLRATAATALFHQQLGPAVAALRVATKADPLDPEPYLELAELYDVEGLFPLEQATLLRAVRVAPIPKAYYRLAQYYEKQGQAMLALQAYKQANALDPNNLQVLHHLGDVYQASGKIEDAEGIYRIMVALEHAPYGTVRAIGDEVVETEFVYGQVGLAEISLQKGDAAEAVRHLEDADALLRLYWSRRNTLTYQIFPALKKAALYRLYLRVLDDLLNAFKREGASAAKLQAVEEERARVVQEHAADSAQQ